MINTPMHDIMKIMRKKFDLMFHCYIPVESHVIKKNNRPIHIGKGGKRFIGKSARLNNAEHYLTMKLRAEGNRVGLFKTITEPVWVTFFFIYPEEEFYTSKGTISKRLGDLSNLYQLPEDCLQGAGLIENDNQIWAHDMSRKIAGKEFAIEIYLWRYQHSSKFPETPILGTGSEGSRTS